MGRHAAHWQPKIDAGEMVVFGPILDSTGSWGLGVVEADDEPGRAHEPGPRSGEVALAAGEVEHDVAGPEREPRLDRGHLVGEVGKAPQADERVASPVVEPRRQRRVERALAERPGTAVAQQVEDAVAQGEDPAPRGTVEATAPRLDLERPVG